MIVQCDQCDTRFKLDDAKVREEGVKVRCSKCKHIFIVKKESPPEETEFESILGQLGSPAPDAGGTRAEETPSSPFENDTTMEVDESEAAPQTVKPAESPSMEGVESWSVGDFGTPDAGIDMKPVSPETQGFDFEQFSFEEESPAGEAVSPAPTGRAAEENDMFTFGEVPAAPGGEIGIAVDVAEKTGRPFAFDPLAAPGAEPSTGGTPAEDGLTFSFANDAQGDFSEGPGKRPASQEEFGPFAAEKATVKDHESQDGGAEPFDFSSVDFGTAAPGGKTPAASKHDISVGGDAGHAYQDTEEFFALSPSGVELAGEDELPPLSIASRRKGVTSAPIIVIAIAVILVLALAGAGFYFLTEGPAGFEKAGLGLVEKWLGLEAKEDGGVSIRNTSGSFVVNKEEGELFVIRGEAVNNFRKPRASIQVKVVLYGPKGQVIAQKSAYCGNMLSDEQVASLPLVKVEEAMNNQFGDSLANLGVQPGNGIPFVVVLSSVPKDVTEFGVEVIGSTVASR